MMKTYKINRMCYINRDNPTPSKSNFEVAVNIVPCRKNDKFENFVLGIDDRQLCCEYFGSGLINPTGKEKFFIKEIEIDVDASEIIKKYDQENVCCYFAVRIKTRDDGDIYAYVFNEHNGFYYHNIYYSNGELKIDVLIDDVL